MSCSDCFRGSVHADERPAGRSTFVHGLQTYVSESTKGKPVKGIIVIIPDAFGWDFVNNRILADHYAAQGHYKVYLPNFMIGSSAPRSMLEYLQSASATNNVLYKAWYMIRALIQAVPFLLRNRVGKTYPIVEGFFEQLRKDEGAELPIGAAGFCWGGKHTLLLSHVEQSGGKPLIDAGFTGHPSMLAIPSDIERSRVPISYAIGERDNQVSPKQAEAVRVIVEAKPQSSRGEVKIYEKAAHGFCIRADLEFADVARQALAAEEQCISWFNTHFELIAA